MGLALERLLALLEVDAGPPERLPATDGWELVLAENVAYLVDDDTRAQCMVALRREVGLDPEDPFAKPQSRDGFRRRSVGWSG